MKKYSAGPTTAGSTSFANQTFASPTFTGAAGFADGTVTAPSIAWTSDQDGTGTGLYRPFANYIDFTFNGVQGHSLNASGLSQPGTFQLMWWTGAARATPDLSIGRGGAGAIVFAGASATAGAVTSRTELNYAKTAIADNTLTAVLTVTIPNAAHSATLRVRLKGSAGAGGAIAANEATKSVQYDIDITRTAGVNAVAAIGTAYGGTTAGASVAGGATITIVGAISAISGAVGVANTFTVNVTIDALTGSSTNHTCFVYCELLNDNASGITIAGA